MTDSIARRLTINGAKSRPYIYSAICSCGTSKDRRAERCRLCQKVFDKTLRRELDPQIYARFILCDDGVVREVACRRIALTREVFAWCNEHRFEELTEHNWSAWWNDATNSYYAVRGEKRSGKRFTILMHNQVLPTQPGYRPDHISKDTLDNTEENLRPATHGENMLNSGKRKNNTSGYKWVTWSKRRKMWTANVRAYGVSYNAGFFDDPKLAHEAAKVIAARVHGKFFRPD